MTSVIEEKLLVRNYLLKQFVSRIVALFDSFIVETLFSPAIWYSNFLCPLSDNNTTHRHDVSIADSVSFLGLKEDTNSQPPKYRISICPLPKSSGSAVIQSN